MLPIRTDTVSYTHLEVYKRQLISLLGNSFQPLIGSVLAGNLNRYMGKPTILCCPMPVLLPLWHRAPVLRLPSSFAPVSYTHLAKGILPPMIL